jgi:hypothetical protein
MFFKKGYDLRVLPPKKLSMPTKIEIYLDFRHLYFLLILCFNIYLFY